MTGEKKKSLFINLSTNLSINIPFQFLIFIIFLFSPGILTEGVEGRG